MADPPLSSSSSSDSEDEQKRQFSNNFDEEDGETPDILQQPPSESDSDPEVPPMHSVYNILKPFHIPGKSSSVSSTLDATTQSGLDNELSIIDKGAESVENSDEPKDDDEGTDDKILMDDGILDTNVEPSLTVDLKTLEIQEENSQSTKEQNTCIHIESVQMDSLNKTNIKPKTAPKPLFRVTDNQNLTSNVEESLKSQSVNESEKAYVDSGEGIGAKVKAEPESETNIDYEQHPDELSEVDYSIVDHSNEDDQTNKITEAEMAKQQTENEQDDKEELNYEALTKDIITDSMIADMKNEEDFQSSFDGMESFAVLDKNAADDDDEKFSTPKEHMSDVEEQDNVDLTKKTKTEVPEMEPVPGTAKEFDNSFVVIGKGTVKESAHGYKSISSSISESELNTSGERFSSENENIEEGKSDNILPFHERLKFFEDTTKEKLQVAVNTAGKHKNNVAYKTEKNTEDSDINHIDHKEIEEYSMNTDIHGNDDGNNNLSSTNDAEESIIEIKENDDNDDGKVNVDDDFDQPPAVPPKSDIVLESLRSITQESNMTHEIGQGASAGAYETADRLAKHTSEPDMHKGNQQTQETDGITREPGLHGSESMPHAQSYPQFTGSEEDYYQYFYPGYPIYSREDFQRLMNDPYHYFHYMQWQQNIAFQQGMAPRQVPKGYQRASFANASDSYRTGSPETWHGQTAGPEPMSVPAEIEEQTFQAQNVQAHHTNVAFEGQSAQHISESLPALKEDTSSGSAEDKKNLSQDSPAHHIEKIEDKHESDVQLRNKQTGRPRPKPRKSMPTKKPKESEVKPAERQKATSKHKVFPQKASKIHPSEPKISAQKVKVEKSQDTMPKPASRTRQPHREEKHKKTQDAQKTESVPKETFLFVKNINPSSSMENLENYLEGGAGNEAEIKEERTMFSRDRTEALVVFSGKPDMSQLKRRCSQKTLDDKQLEVREVPAHTSVAVSSDQDFSSAESIIHYFESTKRVPEETLLFVKNINPDSSMENLENYLEGGAGNEAEIKEETTIYSRDQTEALVVFVGKPDMSQLKKRCSQKTLDDRHLEVCEVPAPTSMAVSSDQDLRSDEAIMYYFESEKSGGGELATEQVLESSDASCKIIQFKSDEVVKRLCDGKQPHKVDGVELKVSPYYRCELGEIWDTKLHRIPLPNPFVKVLPKTQLEFLSRQCCQELKEDLSNKFGNMEITDSDVQITCTLTQTTPNCKSISKTWTNDIQSALDNFLKKLLENSMKVKNDIWEGVCDFLDKGELTKDTLLIEKKENLVYLYGMKAEVEEASKRIKQIMMDLDRKVRRTSETVCLKSPARVKLLLSIGIFDSIEGQFTDLTISVKESSITVEGVPEDIRDAMVNVHEANNDLVYEKEQHNFSKKFVDFLNQAERENKVIQKAQEALKDCNIITEFEITKKDWIIFVPAAKDCQDVKDILSDLLCEEKIHLENESLDLLEEQIWDDLNEDLTERYEDTADVSVDKMDKTVQIVGLKESVLKAKELLERFFEDNTIKSDIFPMDPFTQKFTKKYSMRKVDEIKKKLVDHKVSIQFGDKDVLVKATKKGLQLAKQELKAMFEKICHKDHTFRKVGVTEAMNNITIQINEIETKTRCLIESPFMTESIYSPHHIQPEEADSGATWQNLEDEDDVPQASSVDEAPGYTAKNGLKVVLIKGEIGKQEGSVIVCTTSPKLDLASGAAGKSLIREGGPTLQDECKEIIANKESIKPGEIVAINSGKIECKHIYLTSLPPWKGDSSSIQVLEDIMMDCLQKAAKDNCFSILFCALGTGGLKYPAEEVAMVMYQKAIEFDAANPDTTLKEVKFVLYQKDATTIQAFEAEENNRRSGREKISYDKKFQNTTVTLVTEQLATQKVDAILCTTNKEMNLEASGACKALLAAGGPSLMNDCKTKYNNKLQEGTVVEIGAGKLKCKSIYLTVLPPYTTESEKTLKDVIKTTLGLAQAKKYKSLACIALGTGYLKYPHATAASCMYGAVEEFVMANPGTSLQQIKFVLHAKDTKTIEAFRAYVRGRMTGRRKGRTLDVGKPGKRVDAYRDFRDYNAFPDGCEIRNMTLKVVTGDILEQNTRGIVNSVDENFRFLGAVAGALKKRCPGLEDSCQKKVFQMKAEGIATTHRSKHGGDLKADFIIHIAFQNTLDKWKSKFRKCLERAEKKKLKSLSFPVLGTGAGQHTFKPEEITECLFDAMDEFSATNHHYLKEIRFVVFHKQKFMVDPIIRTLHKKAQAAVTKEQEQKSSKWTKFKGYASDFFFGSKDSSQTTKRTTVKRDEISSVNVKIYSDAMENIDRCIKEIDLALENQYIDHTLGDYKELIQGLNKDEMDQLEKTECIVDMKIDQNAGIVRIKGPKKFVWEAQNSLHRCLKGFERKHQQKEAAETLYQLIQWQYEEVTETQIELVPYPALTNLNIENAYKNKEPSFELFDKNDQKAYIIDFVSLEEYEKGNKENSTKVVRKDILKAAKQALPAEWMDMKDDENIRVVNIPASDPKYQQIEQRFVKEVTTGSYNNRISSVKNVKVTKIDRIQNKALYWQYLAKKELMMKQTPNPPQQFPIEREVWHGTSHTVVSSIQQHGFNRSYAGDKNGTPWYGNGVYFAACASYSARSWLSGANSAGDGTTKGYIFLVKALTGEYCKGQKGMRYLPPKNPSNPTVLYDCAVDNETNPMEFVIFHDAQAYPEYLVTFVS